MSLPYSACHAFDTFHKVPLDQLFNHFGLHFGALSDALGTHRSPRRQKKCTLKTHTNTTSLKVVKIPKLTPNQGRVDPDFGRPFHNFIPDRPRDPTFNDFLRFGHLFGALFQGLPLHVMLLLSVLCKFPATFHPLLRFPAEVISTMNPTSGELHGGNHFRHTWGIPTQPAVYCWVGAMSRRRRLQYNIIMTSARDPKQFLFYYLMGHHGRGIMEEDS